MIKCDSVELDSVPVVHATEELRAARMGWNALLNLRSYASLSMDDFVMINKVMEEMNRNGLFDKPGTVLRGPIPGDIEETLNANR